MFEDDVLGNEWEGFLWLGGKGGRRYRVMFPMMVKMVGVTLPSPFADLNS